MYEGKHRLNIGRNSNWREAFTGLPESKQYLQELLKILSDITKQVDDQEFMEQIGLIEDFSLKEVVRDRVVEIIHQEVKLCGYRSILLEQARKIYQDPAVLRRRTITERDKQIITKVVPGKTIQKSPSRSKPKWKNRYRLLYNKLKSFHKQKYDISEIQTDIYSQVESIILDSDMRYISLIWDLIKLGIPLQEQLISKIIAIPFCNGEPQNSIEAEAFLLAEQAFETCYNNVFLGGTGGVEMDIYLPEEKINLEIDSIKSPKGSASRKRDDFLLDNFGIEVFRIQYDKTLEVSNINEVFDRVHAYKEEKRTSY